MSRPAASIVIARPPAEVFAYMDDVSREPEWQPGLRSATQEPEGPTEVGTKKTYTSSFLGRDVKNTYVVKELEPGRRVVYETTPDSTISTRTEIVCEPDPGGTKVMMRVEGKPKGVLRFVPSSVLETAFTEEVQSALGRLKKLLEEDA